MNSSNLKQPSELNWLIDYSELPRGPAAFQAHRAFANPGRPPPPEWAVSVLEALASGERPPIDLDRHENLGDEAHRELFLAAADAYAYGDAKWRHATWLLLLGAHSSYERQGLTLLQQALEANTPESALDACDFAAVLGRGAAEFTADLERLRERHCFIGFPNIDDRLRAAIASTNPADAINAATHDLHSDDETAVIRATRIIPHCSGWSQLIVPRLLDLLNSTSVLVRLHSVQAIQFVACAFDHVIETALPRLEELLERPCYLTSAAAAEALAMLRPGDPSMLPRIIDLWKSLHHSTDPLVQRTPEVVTSVGQSLLALLPKTNDEELNNFAQMFVPFAFVDGSRYVQYIVNHSFYRRLQRGQLRHQSRAVGLELRKDVLEQLVEDACQELARVLRERPAFGIPPAGFNVRKLPGIMKNVSRDIARKVLRKQVRNPGHAQVAKGWSPAPTEHNSNPLDELIAQEDALIVDEKKKAFEHLLHDLSSEEIALLHCREAGMTWEETAALIKASERHLRHRWTELRKRVACQLGVTDDPHLLTALQALVNVDPSGGPRPRPETE